MFSARGAPESVRRQSARETLALCSGWKTARVHNRLAGFQGDGVSEIEIATAKEVSGLHMVMSKSSDIRVRSARLFFLPVQTRMPLKFGPEVTTSVTCARVSVTVTDTEGRAAEGWGETPLSVQWVWPSALPYEKRHEALKSFCAKLAKAWTDFDDLGHPMEFG